MKGEWRLDIPQYTPGKVSSRNKSTMRKSWLGSHGGEGATVQLSCHRTELWCDTAVEKANEGSALGEFPVLLAMC